MFELYAEAALRLPLPRTYTYLIPESMRETAKAGMRAVVRFRGRQEDVILTAIHNNPPDAGEVLPLEKLIDVEAILTPYQLKLGFRMDCGGLSGGARRVSAEYVSRRPSLARCFESC